jgi:eukaryotic-like serine/threonine-protein kinase
MESAVALAEALRDRYALERELGAGGMATVFLARDLKHHRPVALKVLRAELAAVIGAKRFLQEIETTANLQHPHILPLHDSGEVGGTAYYVMPYVEGESLRDRLRREKQLPIEVAVRIATEVASALDYAHRKGVIHRDIKPENILLHEGQALVADFGIALALSAAGGTRMTETGLSLGTPHYMSPEQAMGEREITGRSDVYALGCVLYEMLTGDPPFTGSTAQAIVAQVVTESPRPMIPRRHTIPAHIEAAVLRALEKLPADRFVTPAEFAQALAAAPAQVTRVSAAAAPTRRSLAVPWTPVLALALLLAAGLAWYFGRPRSGAKALVASLLPPPGCEFDDLGTTNLVQLSPDGSRLAFIAVCGEDHSIWVRAMDTGENRRLGGTAGASYPFWSADGRSLGFFAAERLKRIEVEGGAIRDLAPAPDGRGGSWSADGVILYAPDVYGAAYRIPAEGGTPEPATKLADPASTNVSQRMPHFLPDGEHFLFSQGVSTGVEGRLMVGTLGTLESRQVLDRTSNVTYADGLLFYMLDGVLLAQPFDPGEARFSGTAAAVASGLETWTFRFLGNYSYAAGRLVYREAILPEARVEWFDPGSGARSTVLERGAYSGMRLSPDGRLLLVARPEGRTSREHVWLYEVAEGGWSRLTRTPAVQNNFAWMPDGRHVVLQPENDDSAQFVSVDGAEVETVARVSNDTPIMDWAPGGSFAIGQRQVQETGFDLVRWSGVRDSMPVEVLYATPADERDPRISPDGRYVAYLSNQSGREEVYLARLPGATGERQVSLDGATDSRGGLAWSRTRPVLYFLGPGRVLQSVPVVTSPDLRLGKPSAVPGAPANIVGIEAASDGRLLLLYNDRATGAPLTLVENWTARSSR